MENLQNLFSETLTSLFESKKFKKKDIAILLGVTPASVTQWTKGQTVPEPRKIRLLLDIAESNEDNRDSAVYKKFLSILELPKEQSLGKSASKISTHKLSDYILQSDLDDSSTFLSLLFYNLKSELIEYFTKEVNILISDLTNKFFDDNSSEKSVYKRSKNLRGLDKKFCEEANFEKLQYYTSCIKKYHDSSLDDLLVYLKDIDLNTLTNHTIQSVEVSAEKQRAFITAKRSSAVEETPYWINSRVSGPILHAKGRHNTLDDIVNLSDGSNTCFIVTDPTMTKSCARVSMAKNGRVDDGHRNGAVKDRSQTFNPKTETWVKRDTHTGKFMDGKADGTPFKGVRKENK